MRFQKIFCLACTRLASASVSMLTQRTGPGKLLRDTVFSRLNAGPRINAGSKSGSWGMSASAVYLWYNELRCKGKVEDVK